VEHAGQTLRYIEVSKADIVLANRVAHEVLGRTLDELPPQTRKLLTTLHGWVKVEAERQAMKPADLRFSRRLVRELTGWGDTQLKIHLARLTELEYILAHRVARGQGLEYELVYDGEGDAGGRFLMGLADMAQLDGKATLPYDAQRSGGNAERSAPGRCVVGVQSATGRHDEIALIASAGAACDEASDDDAQKPRQAVTARSSSYRSATAVLAASAAGDA
jgi:hypothetical protein